MKFRSKLIHSTAIALVAASTGAGFAMAAEEEAPADVSANFLDEVVVTGVAKATTVFEASSSVSAIDLEDISNVAPRDTQEILKFIPGVRSEASAGGGNLNLTVRGLPVSAGLKWVSLQEDGLPVLLFGDVLVANVDQFIKFDNTYKTVQSIRGGAASIMTTNGSAGIINFISKTGQDVDGGSAQLTFGIDHDDKRVDFEYGGEIVDDLYYYVGGHLQHGGNVRNFDWTPTSGGQFRVNLHKEMDNGFVRVSAKHIDKREATYMPQPMLVRNNSVTGSFPGLDGGTETLHSNNIRLIPTVDGDGSFTTTDLADGVTTESTTITVEFEYDLGDGWSIGNKARYANITGTFIAPFTNGVYMDADAFYADQGVDPSLVTIFNGVNAGAAADSASLLARNGNSALADIAVFNTEFEDMGNVTNEVKVNKSIELDDGSLDITVGHFFMHQNINNDWHMQRLLTTVENQAAQLDIPGVTTEGLFQHGLPFGWDGSNTLWNLDHTVNAPFLNASLVLGDLTVEGGVRHEIMKATGGRNPGIGAPGDINFDGVIDPAEDPLPFPNLAVRQIQNYEFNETAWTLGANYVINDDVAVFARYSQGHTFNADRPFDGGCVNFSTGEGIESCIIDSTEFIEAGVKARLGDLDLFVTAFRSEATDNNGLFTSGGAPQFIRQDYRAYGVELEFNYFIDNFNFYGTVTWVDSEITNAESAPGVPNTAVIGNTPKRQADLIYSFVSSYTFDDTGLTVGANVVGTTDSYASAANVLTLEGFASVGAFINYDINERINVSVNASNLFDSQGVTESEGAVLDSNGDGFTRARAITGRTVIAKVGFTF